MIAEIVDHELDLRYVTAENYDDLSTPPSMPSRRAHIVQPDSYGGSINYSLRRPSRNTQDFEYHEAILRGPSCIDGRPIAPPFGSRADISCWVFHFFYLPRTLLYFGGCISEVSNGLFAFTRQWTIIITLVYVLAQLWPLPFPFPLFFLFISSAFVPHLDPESRQRRKARKDSVVERYTWRSGWWHIGTASASPVHRGTINHSTRKASWPLRHIVDEKLPPAEFLSLSELREDQDLNRSEEGTGHVICNHLTWARKKEQFTDEVFKVSLQLRVTHHPLPSPASPYVSSWIPES